MDMEYTIIFSTESISDISQKVNNHISDGWKPSGGISATSHDYNLGDGASILYFQAMVRE